MLLETVMNRPQADASDRINTPLNQKAGFLTAFQRKSLQKQLTPSLNRVHRLRIEIMLMGDQGRSQTEICRTLGCSQATARQWLLLARLGEAHRWNEVAIGRPKQVSEAYLARLKELVQNEPRAVGYSFRTWTGEWLSKHLFQEFGVKLSARHVNRLLKEMGLSTRQKQLSCVEENPSSSSSTPESDSLSHPTMDAML